MFPDGNVVLEVVRITSSSARWWNSKSCAIGGPNKNPLLTVDVADLIVVLRVPNSMSGLSGLRDAVIEALSKGEVVVDARIARPPSLPEQVRPTFTQRVPHSSSGNQTRNSPTIKGRGCNNLIHLRRRPTPWAGISTFIKKKVEIDARTYPEIQTRVVIASACNHVIDVSRNGT